MTQVKVGKPVVDRIIEQAKILHQKFDEVPVNQARMVTSFGFCLKSFGEAAVADPKAFDKVFSDNMAQSRLLNVVGAEVWAHEGWKLMQVMNEPDYYVVPQVREIVQTALNAYGLTCRNVGRVFWGLVSGLSKSDLLQLPDIAERDPETHPKSFMESSLKLAATDASRLVVCMVAGQIAHYEMQYSGISAYWRKEVLNAPLADDWDERYIRLIMAQPLIVGELLDAIQIEITKLCEGNPLLEGWVLAPSARFLTLAMYLGNKCNVEMLDTPNSLQRALRHEASPAGTPYPEELAKAREVRPLGELSEYPQYHAAAHGCCESEIHSNMLLDAFHKVLVEAVVTVVDCELQSAPEHVAPQVEGWAMDFLRGE